MQMSKQNNFRIHKGNKVGFFDSFHVFIETSNKQK